MHASLVDHELSESSAVHYSFTPTSEDFTFAYRSEVSLTPEREDLSCIHPYQYKPALQNEALFGLDEGISGEFLAEITSFPYAFFSLPGTEVSLQSATSLSETTSTSTGPSHQTNSFLVPYCGIPVYPNIGGSSRTNNSYFKQLSVPNSLGISSMSLADTKYLSHFLNVVLDSLPSNLDFFRDAAISPNIVLNAALSFGAASMASLKGTYTGSRRRLKTINWSANRIHKVHALRYATKALSLATSHTCSQDLGSLVTAHLMLLYVEVELGTFEGLRRYLTSMNDLVHCEKRRLLNCDAGRKIMRGVEHSRAVLRQVAGPWTTPDVELLGTALSWPQPQYAIILRSDPLHRFSNEVSAIAYRMILCESIRMLQSSRSPTLLLIMSSIKEFITLSNATNADPDILEVDPIAGFEQAREDLRMVRRRLRACKPPAGIPSANACETPGVASSPEDYIAKISPLHFHTHEEAMDAAYYAYTQLFCNEAYFINYLSPDPPFGTLSPWLTLLLRIAAGLDPSNCLYRNKYRRGICGILFLGSLLTSHAAALEYTEDFMDRLVAGGTYWEDHLAPIPVAQPIAEIIRQQMVARGRPLKGVL